MLFIKSRSRREKRKRLLKNVSAVVAVIISFSLVSYLFLSGFNRLEAILGWKNNVIAGFMTGLMAAWILWDVILRYTSRRGRHKPVSYTHLTLPTNSRV